MPPIGGQTTRPPGLSQPMTSQGVIGVVLGCVVLAMLATLAGIVYLKHRGSFPTLDKSGFDNPNFSAVFTRFKRGGGGGASAAGGETVGDTTTPDSQDSIQFGSENSA